MTERAKITPAHTQRMACVYIRQSTPAQVEQHRESTARQYALAARARELGWAPEQVIVIDEDLGLSGASSAKRAGFVRLTTAGAQGHVGLLLGLEVSRLARNNAAWYRLLDLCGLTNTLIGDGDGVSPPALVTDRLVLGLKGPMREAALHLLRARLDGGIRNKAARGERRRGLPVGFVWGEADGEVRFHPDAAVTGAIRTVFARFAALGSARQVWLWFRAQGLAFPLQLHARHPLRWVAPTYTAIHHVLTNPVYAGASAYGKTRREGVIDGQGGVTQRTRHLSRDQWTVLLPEHHPGFIDWTTFLGTPARLDANVHPAPHQAEGAVREGTALLQGLAVCGNCGRRLHTHSRGRTASPGYHCAGQTLVNGRGLYCLNGGGVQIDQAVAAAFLEALTPAALAASVVAAQSLEAAPEAALAQWRLAVERARYEMARAERRYRAVDPENRLVARGLEAEWEARRRELATAEAALRRRAQARPRVLSPAQRQRLAALATDLPRGWAAPTTTARERKELLRTLLEEGIIRVERAQRQAQLTLRWRGGTVTTRALHLPRSHPPRIRTDEGTLTLLPRLAAHYPDAVIAGILNRQGRTTVHGDRFTAMPVGSLRRYRHIPRYVPPTEPADGERVTIKKAAEVLGVVPSTIHRWLNDGFIAGAQLTPGAPWQIRLTAELRARFVEEAPPEYLPMLEATLRLGVSRQTVLQRVKRGELEAVHVRCGRRKGLRIKVLDTQPSLFPPAS